MFHGLRASTDLSVNNRGNSAAVLPSRKKHTGINSESWYSTKVLLRKITSNRDRSRARKAKISTRQGETKISIVRTVAAPGKDKLDVKRARAPSKRYTCSQRADEPGWSRNHNPSRRTANRYVSRSKYRCCRPCISRRFLFTNVFPQKTCKMQARRMLVRRWMSSRLQTREFTWQSEYRSLPSEIEIFQGGSH